MTSGGRWLIFGGLFLVVFAVSGKNVPVGGESPRLSAFQESTKTIGILAAPQESKVTITVGEKTGFAYTLNGYTQSPYKIAVSGEYFNDPVAHDGYVRLYLVVDTGIAYYSLRPSGNILDVYVQNGYRAEFYFEILCPYPVRAYDLWEGQINATAVLVTGPSSSAVRRSGVRSSIDFVNLGGKGDVVEDVKETI
ncbi:uncharacterized protein LOC110857090 [Folsomia candida]|uniref:Uncharacterized protein n=1 Tax=Folsomia candida TaxID=158441 RepID=A0A226DL32_FOLCA|nr:uncharacterized protein LOC110857090 [Folsomia candida]OXA45544.1 hypothetical protein Fcan01_19427 [Folsomia candida]